jgi:hypothetical protein
MIQRCLKLIRELFQLKKHTTIPLKFISGGNPGWVARERMMEYNTSSHSCMNQVFQGLYKMGILSLVCTHFVL